MSEEKKISEAIRSALSFTMARKTWSAEFDKPMQEIVESSIRQGIKEYRGLGGPIRGRSRSVAWDRTRGCFNTWRERFDGGDLQNILDDAIAFGIEATL